MVIISYFGYGWQTIRSPTVIFDVCKFFVSLCDERREFLAIVSYDCLYLYRLKSTISIIKDGYKQEAFYENTIYNKHYFLAIYNKKLSNNRYAVF